jgi:hypothetical protein
MKRLAAALLLCSCGHRNLESTAQSYARALTTLQNGRLAEASAQTRAASKRCGSDLPCRWRFQLLEAEILSQQRKDREAGAILSQDLPAGPDFAALDLRRRMLLGYLLTRDDARAEAGRKLLDEAYLQAVKLGLRD